MGVSGLDLDDGGVAARRIEDGQLDPCRDAVVSAAVDVASRLRKIGKPVLRVVNKMDVPGLDANAPEFYRLGGEPIVCTPEDAYRCFLRTEMDYLIIGPFVLARPASPAAPLEKGRFPRRIDD